MSVKGVFKIHGILTSMSGMLNAIRRTNITANNIANIATPGFKAARADNVELEGGGVRIGAITHDGSPGPPLLDPAPDGPTEGSNVGVRGYWDSFSRACALGYNSFVAPGLRGVSLRNPASHPV